MARIVVLDAGPLWLAAGPSGKSQSDDCRDWIKALGAAGVVVSAPEIADYEVRREFILRGATAGLRRLDGLKSSLDYRPITTETMIRAAELWASLRRGGLPTAGPRDLDGDAILAGAALTEWGSADVVTIATTNLRHLGRFPGVDARLWSTVT